MDRDQIHYEVFIRPTVMSPWRLEMASESRSVAVDAAEAMMADKRAVAVRVTKETLDPGTMEFQSITLFTRGAPEPPRRVRERDPSAEPPCMAPQDLYTTFAREKVGRVLEDWLRRNRATPFELLHRPDLVERLEASGVELQHAIQKISIPESQAGGQSVHEVVRAYQRLTDQAVERVIAAGRRKRFPDLAATGFADAARALMGEDERAFLLGGAVCAVLADCKRPRDKVARLLDLMDQAPAEPQPLALCRVVIEQPLAELMADPAALADVLGPELDLGGYLAALTRLAAPREVEALIAVEAGLARDIPRLDGIATRLGELIQGGAFKMLGVHLARRVIKDLTGPRRLRPSDARGEIDVLRALAMTLTASAGRLLSLEEVQEAFVTRSRAIVTADFVEAYLRDAPDARAEVDLLVRLCENVTGAGNKRDAARWLQAAVSSPRFEKEARGAAESPATSLARLASVQRHVLASGLAEGDTTHILRALGEVGGRIEAEARICDQLVRSPAPPLQKVTLLLRLAAGEAAPSGPAAERARGEVVRLMKSPQTREALAAASPEAVSTLRPLLHAAGLAA